MKMRTIYYCIMVVILFVNCKKPEYFDHVEYLKQFLIKCGFHPDTSFNMYREYSWKVKTSKADSLLLREAAFYLLDTVYQNQANFTPVKSCYLLLQEYQYLPNRKNEYVQNSFPSVYEEEKKKNLFLEHFYNVSKGLRHGDVPRLVELQQKVMLKNRYVQLIASIKRENVNDTVNARKLLKIIERGVIQQNGKNAKKKYLAMRENPLLQNNLYIERKIIDTATADETNRPPMDEEAEVVKSLERAFYNRDIPYHCIDICGTEGGCINGGYISITVQTASGLPVDSAVCCLLTSNKYRYYNKTNGFGSVRWCRVKKDRYTIEICFKGVKHTLSPVWDSLPRMELFKLK